jgi:ATP-dependent DNA helicase RecG
MNGSYSANELNTLLVDLESELVERKETANSTTKSIREAICAFANDLSDHRAPGVIFVGARDDGSTTGIAVTDNLLKNLAAMKDDGTILPPPSLSVRELKVRNESVAAIVVQPSASTPISYRGRIWIRVGPTTRVATREDERRLVEKRRMLDIDFDAEPVPSASLDDLDLRRFETDYLPLAVSRDVLLQNERSVEEQLAALKMIAKADEPVPTVTGLLILGKHPQDFLPGAHIQFLRIAGSEWGDPIIDEERCDGPILDQITRLEEKLNAHVQTSIDFTSGLVEQRRASYPLSALQQLTRNAVMHRTYEGSDRQTLVYWFDDHIEIISPGAPVGGVTIERLGDSGFVAYRNPNLAEAMKVLGLMQRFGVGIATARRDLHANGQDPPEFEFVGDRVFCRLRARR